MQLTSVKCLQSRAFVFSSTLVTGRLTLGSHSNNLPNPVILLGSYVSLGQCDWRCQLSLASVVMRQDNWWWDDVECDHSHVWGLVGYCFSQQRHLGYVSLEVFSYSPSSGSPVHSDMHAFLLLEESQTQTSLGAAVHASWALMQTEFISPVGEGQAVSVRTGVVLAESSEA